MEQVTESDASDVLVNTSLYGIHNPENLHSFSHAYHVFIPTPCVVCKKPVFPFIQACYCLRCKCVTHRQCVGKAPQCAYFTFNDWKEVSYGDAKLDSAEGLTIAELIDKAVMIPKVLGYIPAPGSDLCIWRCILRAVARSRHLFQATAPRSIADLCRGDIGENETFRNELCKILEDYTTFAGVVACVCHAVFLMVDFGGIHDETMRHARECLDTVICALISCFSMASTADDDTLNAVCRASDSIMLGQEFGIMYEKIFKTAVFEARDSSFYQILTQEKSNTKFHGLDINTPRDTAIDAIAAKLVRERTAIGKLEYLVEVLQLLSQAVTYNDKAMEYDLCDDAPSALKYSVEVELPLAQVNSINTNSAQVVMHTQKAAEWEEYRDTAGVNDNQAMIQVTADTSQIHSDNLEAVIPKDTHPGSCNGTINRSAHSESVVSDSYEKIDTSKDGELSQQQHEQEQQEQEQAQQHEAQRGQSLHSDTTNATGADNTTTTESLAEHVVIESATLTLPDGVNNSRLISIESSNQDNPISSSSSDVRFRAGSYVSVSKYVEEQAIDSAAHPDISHLNDSGVLVATIQSAFAFDGTQPADCGQHQQQQQQGEEQEDNERQQQQQDLEQDKEQQQAWVDDIASPVNAVICTDEADDVCSSFNVSAAVCSETLISHQDNDDDNSTAQSQSNKPAAAPVDTDTLIDSFTAVIRRQMTQGCVRWIAECKYITSPLLRDAALLTGAEGYALATLQQCMAVLQLQHQEDITHS